MGSMVVTEAALPTRYTLRNRDFCTPFPMTFFARLFWVDRRQKVFKTLGCVVAVAAAVIDGTKGAPVALPVDWAI